MNLNKNNKKTKLVRGFTLIEMLISVAIFTTIMFITTGSIFTIFDSNRKSQSLRAVMDNLNLTMESMTRTIRFGYKYHCDIDVSPFTDPRDCSSGADSIAIMTSPSSRVLYRLNSGVIERSTTDGASWTALTGTDVTITRLSFRVFGSAIYPGDLLQPQVIIVVSGYAGNKTSSQSSFTIETTVSQRRFDTQ